MVTGKITDITGKIEKDTGKITGKTIEDTGKINQDTGKIELSEDFSGENTGKMPETTGESDIARYRGQRGPDKKKRNFPPQTLKNLPQFRDKPHEEVRQYILEKKGVDIGSNFNWNGLIIAILVVSGIIAGSYGLYLMIKHLQKRRNVVTSVETY